MNKLKNIIRYVLLFILTGGIYYTIEMCYRGYSHWSMFILAGICGVCFIDTPNNIYSFEMDYIKQILMSTTLCTCAEGLTGYIVNIWLGLNVWDYSNLPLSFFYGQCNLLFVGAWFILCAIGIILCDAYNYYICHIEPCPYYKINGKLLFKIKERKHK